MTKLRKILNSINVELKQLHGDITEELQDALEGVTNPREISSIVNSIYARYNVPKKYEGLLHEKATDAALLANDDLDIPSFRKYVKGSVAVDGEKLSSKIHDLARTDEITKAITSALNVEKKWGTFARDLVDKEITKGEVPKYIESMLGSARQARDLTGDIKAASDYRRAVSRAYRQIEKLTDEDTSKLARAYKDLAELSTSASAEVVDATVERAVMFKARANAQRLLNTEAARAYGNVQIDKIQKDEDAVGIQWNLSEQHDNYCICDWFAEADMFGMGAGIYPKDEVPDYPAHPWCITGENRVSFHGKLVSAYKSFYRGIIVKVILESGKRFSVTVNHPILTSVGWVVAKELTKAHKIIACIDSKRPFFDVLFGLASSKPNNNKRPPRIKDIFRAVKKSPDMSSTMVPATIKYLHGDGRFIDGNINVVNTNGFLLCNIQSAINKNFSKSIFSWVSSALVGFFGNSFFNKFFSWNSSPLRRFMCSICDSFSIFRRINLFRMKSRCFSNSAPLDIGFYKSESDNISRNPVAVRDALLRFSAGITFDNIIKIKMMKYNGHVYDLSVEPDEIYMCNGVIVKNCACTLDPVYEGEAGEYDDKEAKAQFDDLDEEDQQALVGKEGSWDDLDWDDHKVPERMQ